MPLLLEVGCEEIPARFLRDAEKGLGERVHAVLDGAGLLRRTNVSPEPSSGTLHDGPVQTYSTPRRLVVHVAALLAQQPDKVEEVLGPPVKVAIDAEGNYTRAAESFAQKNSARIEDLARTTTPKGEYLSLSKTTPGRPALEILAEILPGAILGLTFPKSMYWTEKSAPRFVRPIRWIVALLGEGKHATTVDFNILGVNSGNFTFGHRAKSGKALLVKGFKDYANKLTEEHVEIDYNRRLKLVIEGSLAAGASVGRIVQDGWLMDWIANSTEWPHPMLGSFDERFLSLPREILITVMRDHQRYFAVEDDQGNLRPNFVVVLNMDSDEKGLIRQGHQRVLTARFRDAEFFWNADQKIPLRDRVPLLEKVTYQAKLGTYGDKVRRMERVGLAISYGLINQRLITQAGLENVKNAIQLSKCDLTTQMVQEFTELQGVVGGLYAKFQGENEEIAEAIYDHYKPQGAEDGCPRNLVGAIVAVADKIDGVVSGFVAGFVPKGSSDPYGLRRQANGFVRIMIEFSIYYNLRPLILSLLDAFSYNDLTLQIHTKRANALADDIVEFIRERVGFYLEASERLEYDIVRAALGAREPTWNSLEDNPVNIVERAKALKVVRASEGFVRLCSAAKRIRNILSKSAASPVSLGGNFNEGLFENEVEMSLGLATQGVEGKAEALAREGKFILALGEITKLVSPVDKFFDVVLVMTDDRRIRENRLRLLNRLSRIFSAIVDLSQIVAE